MAAIVYENVDVPVPVVVNSGVNVTSKISGQTIVVASGVILKPVAPSALLAGYIQLNTQSGGSELASGAVIHVNIKNINTSGDIWIGPPGVLSGTGFLLEIGDEKSVDIDNLNKVYVYPEFSGDYVTYLGEVE